MFGRARIWNVLPQRFRFDLLEGFTRLSHPLTRPAEYLRNYERLWDRSRDVTPTFAARLGQRAASFASTTPQPMG
jgi:hypothetical protein